MGGWFCFAGDVIDVSTLPAYVKLDRQNQPPWSFHTAVYIYYHKILKEALNLCFLNVRLRACLGASVHLNGKGGGGDGDGVTDECTTIVRSEVWCRACDSCALWMPLQYFLRHPAAALAAVSAADILPYDDIRSISHV